MRKVSVVMSSYNHQAFVAAAVESVLTQDYACWEMIVRDDRSDDDTAKILASYRDPRIKHLEAPVRLGGAESLNRCLDEATGEFVVVMNSDDVMLPHRISTELAAFDANPGLGAVFSHAEIIDESGRPYQGGERFDQAIFSQANRSQADWLRRFFEKGNCLCHPSAMIRKSVYEKVGRYDPHMLQLPDFDMWVRICAQFEIFVCQQPLLQFRVLRHGRNASSDSAASRERMAYELIQVLDRYTEPAILDQVHEIFPEWASAGDDRRKKLMALVNAALSLPSSPHHFFALTCLRRCVVPHTGADPGFMGEWFSRVLSANPFSLLFTQSLRCRVFAREHGAEFQGRAFSTRALVTGGGQRHVLALPAGTTQVRLEIEPGYSTLEISHLSLEDAHGGVLWNIEGSNGIQMQISGGTLLSSRGSSHLLAGGAEPTRLVLPEVPGGRLAQVAFTLEVHVDHVALVRENQRLFKEVKSLKKTLTEAGCGKRKHRKGSWLASLWAWMFHRKG